MKTVPIALIAFAARMVSSAWAQETPAAPAPAETSQEAPASTPSPTPAPPTRPFVAGYNNGFTLQSETGDYVLKLTGYIHADGRFAAGDAANGVTDTFLIRRARPTLQGTVAKYFDFYLNPTSAGNGGSCRTATSTSASRRGPSPRPGR